jgi:hypothetical protein
MADMNWKQMLEELKQTKTIIIILLVLLLIAAAAVAWYQGQSPAVGSKKEYIKIPGIKAAKKIKRSMMPVKEVSTIEKQAISEKLKLPEAIAKDENKQVISTGEVAPYEGKTNVAAILNTKTGESEIIAKQQPLSLFDFENKKEIGVRYGYSIKNYQEADIYGRWDFLRVGNMHLGIYGEMTSTGDGKAMLSVGYRW